MATVTTTPQLTGEDRCDRCGAQAYVKVLLVSGRDLLFCAHHFTQHSAALRPITAEVVDESHRLLQP